MTRGRTKSLKARVLHLPLLQSSSGRSTQQIWSTAEARATSEQGRNIQINLFALWFFSSFILSIRGCMILCLFVWEEQCVCSRYRASSKKGGTFKSTFCSLILQFIYFEHKRVYDLVFICLRRTVCVCSRYKAHLVCVCVCGWSLDRVFVCVCALQFDCVCVCVASRTWGVDVGIAEPP